MGAMCAPDVNPAGRNFSAVLDPCTTLEEQRLNCTAVQFPRENMVDHQLLRAAREGDVTNTKVAILAGADLETRRPLLATSTSTDSAIPAHKVNQINMMKGLTPLMYAAQSGSAPCATTLVDARADVHARDEDGAHPLHFAAAANALKVAELLVQAGADRHALDDQGHSISDYLPDEVRLHPPTKKKWMELLASDTFEAKDLVRLGLGMPGTTSPGGMLGGRREKKETGTPESAAADPRPVKREKEEPAGFHATEPRQGQKWPTSAPRGFPSG